MGDMPSAQPVPALQRTGTAELFEFLVSCSRGQGSLREALQLSSSVLERLLDRAIGLMKVAKFAEAEKLFFGLAAVEPDWAIAMFFLGACRHERRDLTGAIDAYTEAMRRAVRTGSLRLIPKVRLCRAQAALALRQDDGPITDPIDDLSAVENCDDPIARREAQRLLVSVRRGGLR